MHRLEKNRGIDFFVSQEKNRGIAFFVGGESYGASSHLIESVDFLLEPRQQRMAVVQVPLDLVRGLRSRGRMLLHRRRSSEREQRGVALGIVDEGEVWEAIHPGTRERHQRVRSASSEHSTRHISPLSPSLDPPHSGTPDRTPEDARSSQFGNFRSPMSTRPLYKVNSTEPKFSKFS